MRNRELLQSDPGETLAQGSEPGGHTVFVGGFPCQDLSVAGKQAGRKGARSGLYRQYLAVISAERPAWIVTENVGHTWRKWVPHLRRSLHRLGYASLPLRVLASDLGAHHARARIFLVAHADGELLRKLSRWWVREGRQMADEFAKPCEERAPSHTDGMRELQSSRGIEEIRRRAGHGFGWGTEPDVERVVYGVSNGMDRIAALGNAVIPQIPQIIARGIKLMQTGEVPVR